MIFDNIFHPPREEIVDEPELLDSDIYLMKEYPCLRDLDALNMYKQFLFRAGHCPECNDFLMIDVTKDGEYYTAVKRCLDRNCNYTHDISRAFNEAMGLTLPEEEEPKEEVKSDNRKHYVDTVAELLMDYTAPKSTGTLKSSVPKNPPSHYWDLNMDNRTWVGGKIIKLSKIPNCPNCFAYDWNIDAQYKIETMRVEAIATCGDCGAVYDVTDFYAWGMYCETLAVKDEVAADYILKEYGLNSVRDCEMRLVKEGESHKMSVSGFNYL